MSEIRNYLTDTGHNVFTQWHASLAVSWNIFYVGRYVGQKIHYILSH